MEKRTLQKLGLLCASVALCSAASWWNSNEEADQQVKKLAEQPVAEQVQEIKITVCVSGAVAKPGLYEVTKGSRAQQVIDMQRWRTHQSSATVKGETETENSGTKICKGRRYFRGNSGGRAL